MLPVDGEVFVLRKLLPQTPEMDFNIHIMDFKPGKLLYAWRSCAVAMCSVR